jgi:choline dehydrogenase-like flavoprotein
MPDNYDVIIIGSGAGGGTLARQLAPTGKRILILERGDWLKREAANWDAKAVFVDNDISLTIPGMTATVRRSSRRSTTLSAARQKCTARLVSLAA